MTATLAPLRQDLRLYASHPEPCGAPAWVIQDPISNRFYRIGWVEYECLLRWPRQVASSHGEAIVADINQNTALNIDASTLDEVAAFLADNFLLRPSAEVISRIKQQSHRKTWRDWRWWLRNYLFIRLPLVRPDAFLTRLLPVFRLLITPLAGIILAVITLSGLLLIMREWDQFTHGLLDLFTPSGLVGFALALIVSKMLHELGHALMATHLGVRVAHMGVAFLVMWPMLYTDTGESWRLRHSRQRLAISVAGISVELALAGIASLWWGILDDGPWRQAMLYLASTAWILSLALNISPFMRFDGYFILSDLLNFPNLHQRAGDLAKVRLRRAVLGLKEPDPERFSRQQARFLTGFAFVTWLYRLLVFLAIAWAIYTLFFKVLGIILFVVEIIWFVLKPIGNELMVWRKKWPQVRRSRRWLLVTLAALGLLWFVLPRAMPITAPALSHAAQQQFVYAPFAAQLVHSAAKGPIAQGQILVTLTSPDLSAQQKLAKTWQDTLSARLAGLMTDDDAAGTNLAVVQQAYEQAAEYDALQAEQQRLKIKADFNGVWLDIDPSIDRDSWLSDKDLLGVLISPQSWELDAYVSQQEVARISVGAQAWFYANGHWRGQAATVASIDEVRVQRSVPEALDANHGGRIMTFQQPLDQQSLPIASRYRVRLTLVEAPAAPYQEQSGYVQIDAERQSQLWQGGQWLLSVLIRESGF